MPEYRRLSRNARLFLQLLGQPLISREFLIAAATGRRGLRGLAGQLLQPANLGLERVAFSLQRVAFGGQRNALRFERVSLGCEIGDNLVSRRFVRSDLISGGFVGSRFLVCRNFVPDGVFRNCRSCFWSAAFQGSGAS